MIRLVMDGGALMLVSQVLASSTTEKEIDTVEKIDEEIGLNLDGAN